ncbi:TIGR04255 family protein [Methylosinus sp. PW1]|uniref:TIGR04255 family protein n=1 Tax=Methylosinus sp. PW1 TaxID=107636 RepID=UPI0018DB207D|nr:TIGR04255 family protein [Methylosinus sp. PW1]
MSDTSRPEHLPDFKSPPLNEVVLGVQFEPAREYKQILATEVWQLFRSEYPFVEETQALPPTFEVFGRSGPARGLQFGLVTGAQHDRFWFVSPSKEQLIQFQIDRLLHNWRKVGDKTNEYPRFEKMIFSFEKELRTLEAYFNQLEPQRLMCNQAEISYINQIRICPNDGLQKIGDWLRFVDFFDEPNDITCVTRRVLFDAQNNQPVGRLSCEMNYARDPKGGGTIDLNLTVRGAPSEQSIDAAISFLKYGREVIGTEFASITTDSAHNVWERVR